MSRRVRNEVPPEYMPASGSARSTGSYLSRALRPHLPPWLCAAGVGAAGSLASLRWEGSAGAAVGLTAATGVLTAATWWAGRSTTSQRRLHSAISVAAASAWTTGAALAGPTAGVLPDMFLMGAPVVALSWNVRIALRTSDPEGSGASSDGGLLAKIGLARAQLGAARVEPNKVTIPYAIEPGEGTNEDAAKGLGRLAGALDVPATAVRHQPDPESAARGQFIVTPIDMLRRITWYPGPSRPGGSIAEPLVVGVYDDGRPLEITLPLAIHLMIMGMTGSGKTEAALDLLCEILTRSDANVWLSDHVKRGQDLAAIFPACDWAVTTPQGTEAMIEAVKAAIPARTEWLGAHSYRAWEPAAAKKQTDPKHSCKPSGACGCPGMSYLTAWFEECANTLATLGDDVFTTIAQEARSAGVSLVVSMQRASGYQISTDTRESIPSVLCFGVGSDTDAGFALPDEVLDMGANPAAWSNRRPGYLYAVAAGIDEELYANPARSYRNDPVALEWVSDTFAPIRMAIDTVTATAAASVAGRAYTGRAPVDEHEEDIVGERQDVDDDDFDDDLDVDPEAELPPLPEGADVPFASADTGRKPSPEEARTLLARALDEFEQDGVMVVGPKDFMDWCDTHGYSRPWVSARLREAYEEGRLQETGTPGRWRIVPTLTPA
jgi:hypothetical protein